MQPRNWWAAYRVIALRDGSSGVHRGMTAMSRPEWRAASEARAALAITLRDPLAAPDAAKGYGDII